jgi:hypothetical protein
MRFLIDFIIHFPKHPCGRKLHDEMRRRSRRGSRALCAQKGKKRASIYKKEKLKNLILKAGDDHHQFKHLGITLKKGMDLLIPNFMFLVERSAP